MDDKAHVAVQIGLDLQHLEGWRVGGGRGGGTPHSNAGQER
jgi:hypothetical protein